MGRQLILSGADFSAGGLSLNWRPSMLGANLAAWLKADAGVTSSAGAVSQLLGQSTNAYALVQTTSAEQPALTANEQNNLPGIASSSATAQVLATAPAAVQFEYNKPFSLLLAFKRVGASPYNGNNSWEAIMSCMDPAAAFRGWFVGGSKPSGGTFTFALSYNGAQAYAINVHGATVLAAGHPYIATVTYDGSGHAAGVSITLNGAAETMTTVNDTLGTNTAVSSGQRLAILGGSNAIAGFQSIDSFLEGVVVNRVLSAQEIAYAQEYLKGRWAAY